VGFPGTDAGHERWFMPQAPAPGAGLRNGSQVFPKNPSHSNTSGYFLRKGWNYCHTTAFLIDSQAKIP
jgi:hypothetical protein